ncbi:MAG TPA: hypothetical protein VNY29_17535 [Terriglobales bacterium]|nr:hypothetical protein [Terriglobales bacterium]
MKRLGRWLLIIAFSLALLLGIAITFTIGWRPFLRPKARPLTARSFERTPQRLERGHYIATALSGCSYCHTPHDWTAPGTPMIAGREGAGGILPYYGLPGRIVAPTSRLIPKLVPGAGPMTNSPAPSAKASVTTVAPFSPSCPTPTTATCQTKTWPPPWSTCAPCRRPATSCPPLKSFFP